MGPTEQEQRSQASSFDASELPPIEHQKPPLDKDRRYRIVSGFIIGVLLLIAIIEGAIIWEQRRVTQQVEAESEAAFGRFMTQGKTASDVNGSAILLKNVQYCWSQDTCIVTNRLSATASPINNGSDLTFDNLTSFMVNVHNGTVRISPTTLEGMFNESVFNYPGSNLRNLSVSIREAGQQNRIKLAGSLKYFLWIPFEMDTSLHVNKSSNTLVISVYSLKVFGIIPATWLIELKPFNLQKLLTLPPNRHLTVRQNLMMVKPFGLFPPPRINGTMSNIRVLPNLIELTFSGKEPGSLQTQSDNIIAVKGGNPQFGKIKLLDADVMVQDQSPGTPFKFSLLNYLDYLPSSQVQLKANGGVHLIMKDHINIPDMGQSIERPANQVKPSENKRKDDDRSLLDKTKDKVKNLFN